MLDYPGLWLLTLKRERDFLPLNFPDRNLEPGLFAINPDEEARAARSIPDDAPPSSWFMTSLLATAVIIVGCILLLACNVYGWLERPRWLVVTDQFKTRLMALLGACLALSALIWILAPS